MNETENEFKKAIYYYLKYSDKNSIELTRNDLLKIFLRKYRYLIHKLSEFENLVSQTKYFEDLEKIVSPKNFSYLMSSENQKEELRIAMKKGFMTGRFVVNETFQKFNLFMRFNENGSLFFRMKNKKSGINKYGIVHPEKNYISVFYSNCKGYQYQLTLSNDKKYSYQYQNYIKVIEVESYFNEYFVDFRELVIDLENSIPVQARVSFFEGSYELKQMIGQNIIIDVDSGKGKGILNKKAEKVLEIVSFVEECKGDFLAPLNYDDKVLFDMAFPPRI